MYVAKYVGTKRITAAIKLFTKDKVITPVNSVLIQVNAIDTIQDFIIHL